MYPAFLAQRAWYQPEDRVCIERLVTKLQEVQTSGERPGMLLGKIQSGKTKTFLGAVALGFDNGFDIAIILTKGTKALTRQTVARTHRDFGQFRDRDLLQVYDIMTLPEGLTGYELHQKIIIVAKKQVDNLERLETLFRDTYPQLRAKRVLIIDDEADYASVGFRNSQTNGIDINVTGRRIDQLRATLGASAFLQVTATPYSLYLQPEEMVIQGIEFRPIRPAFTELVPVSPDYIGSDYYFDRSQEKESIASYMYRPISTQDLEILRKSDRRRFRIEEALTNPVIETLRDAICNFLVGGVIRRLQDAHANVPPKKFAFLFHTESQRAAHAWQEEVVHGLRDQLTDAVDKNRPQLEALLVRAYEDLKRSIQVQGSYLPAQQAVLDAASAALRDGWLMITKVNSEQQVEQLLDDEGQLRLRTPLNIFIGGQILDRGVTIANLIGFYYGRRPQVYQQDTVLQHSRMFGFRPVEDLAVTRFYTEPQIYTAMRRMHESDVALRESIIKDPEAPVIFIRRDAGGQVIPCSPNKVLMSNTTTLRPFKRILPVGFQTDYATRVRGRVEEVDRTLERLAGDRGFEDPFPISLKEALGLLTAVEPTIEMSEDEGFTFDWTAARAALTYMSQQAKDPARRGTVWCLVEKDRKITRTVSAGSHAVYADAPDSTKTEGAIARKVAIDRPMLMMIRQNGSEEQGWRGTPFYWPVIVAQQEVQTAIFAHETMP
jgi:Z1 domain